MLDAQKARIHVAGKKESATAEIDVNCIGEGCAFFITTDQVNKLGVCAPAMHVKLANDLLQIGNRNETRVNAFAVAVTEACEETTVVPPIQGEVDTHLFFDLLGKKMRKLFASEEDDAPEPKKPSHLSPVK